MIRIYILYFAGLRDQRGCDGETLDVETGATPESVYRRLQKAYGFRWSSDSLQVAVNQEFAGWDARLRPGDELVFLPPMAGG